MPPWSTLNTNFICLIYCKLDRIAGENINWLTDTSTVTAALVFDLDPA